MKKIITHRKINKKIDTLDHLIATLDIKDGVFYHCVENAAVLYSEIKLVKKDGKTRLINAPQKKLKIIQRLLLDKVFSGIKLLPCVYGFSSSTSVVANAKVHSKSDHLLNLDLQNFFPSVHMERVKGLYADIGLGNIAAVLCRLTTLEHQLPQGAPTSPFLASLALTNLDHRLYSLARKNNLFYTRYFDDLSFSGGKRVTVIEKDILRIIVEEGYKTKKSKRALYEKGETKEINGICALKGKLFLKNTDEILGYINDLATYGLERLQTANPIKECQSLKGKIAFLKQVDPVRSLELENAFLKIKW